MRTAVFVLVLALLPLPAFATDLGDGNVEVGKTFAKWVEGGPRLKASDCERRVLISGFGLFSGVDYNISGVVVESMANEAFWPKGVRLDEAMKTPAKSKVKSGLLTEKDGGAKVWQRTLVIDGETYEVGFLLLDVLWDLGAAITLYEAKTFKPHLIVMTGRGGQKAIFEKGALNQAAGYPGFRSDGAQDPKNTPVTPNVLDPKLDGIEAAIGMTWDNTKLADAARPVVDSMKKGYAVMAADAARPRNTYICNNISCAVLHGIKRDAISLAGGKIKITGVDLSDTTAGFFHYPAASTNEPAEVLTWARMLATVVKTQFESTTEKAEDATAGTR